MNIQDWRTERQTDRENDSDMFSLRGARATIAARGQRRLFSRAFGILAATAVDIPLRTLRFYPVCLSACHTA